MRDFPTLQELVKGWVRCGWSKKAAVSQLVELHLRYDMAKGNGRKAAGRAALIQANTEREEDERWFESMKLTDEDLTVLSSRFSTWLENRLNFHDN